MYFYRKKSGTGGETLQLLESYRKDGQPRHHVVVSLGSLDMPLSWDKPMAEAVSAKLRGELPLFAKLPKEAAALFDRVMARVEVEGTLAPRPLPKPVPAIQPGSATQPGQDAQDAVEMVLVGRISHSHNVPLGPYLPGLEAWEALGMTPALLAAGLSPRQTMAAEALVLGKMAEPLSEHAFHAQLPMTALPDLLGAAALNLSLDCLYRAGDKLLEAEAAVKRLLRAARGPKEPGQTMLLYDLTNSHFEGLCERNPQAMRGKNKQKRDDCLPVVVGVVFDEQGLVVAHKVFPGNQSDPKSLPEMVEAMRAEAGSQLSLFPPTVVVDGGIGTKDNIKALHKAKLHYIVHEKRPTRGNWEEEFAQGGFAPVPGRDPLAEVRVKTVDIPAEAGGWPERALLCRSEGRREKEDAILSRAETRLLDDLSALSRRVGKKGAETAAELDQAVGRLRERHPRVARFYAIATAGPDGKPSLSWLRRSDAMDAAKALLGGYVLRTDRTDLEGPRLWRLYMTLGAAEDAFRSLKSELSLRPLFHQLEQRVKAHVLITLMAYQLTQYSLLKLERAGDGRSWSTIRRVLSSHCYATILLPRPDGSTIRIRRPGEPEQGQLDIYKALGVRPMNRLPASKMVVPASGGQTENVVTPKNPALSIKGL